MKIITSLLGYTIALLCIVITLATFVAMGYTSRVLIETTGLTVSPWIIGGKIVQTIDHLDYRTDIRQKVFQGLLAERDEGFVQIDWVKKNRFPERIIEEVDLDRDGLQDFRIDFNTIDKRVIISPDNSDLLSRVETFDRKQGYTVRIWLKNEKVK